MKELQILLTGFALASLLLAGKASAHSHIQVHDHSGSMQMANPATAVPAPGQSDQSSLKAVAEGVRDPHAYSNGFRRNEGAYALENSNGVTLADSKAFLGVWVDRLEVVDHVKGTGQELEGYAWYGNSFRRLIVQSQVETVEGEIEEGEVDIFYSQAVSPFWNVRGGLHHSFGENANRDWVAVGVKGLAPYWFEIEANLHIGDGGRTAFDFEAEYELLLTQRLVLQPRLDVSAFSKTDLSLGQGRGLSTVKAGARLRYEFDRQFAPYIGVERVQRFGRTSDLLPTDVDESETHWVIGLRIWL